MRVRGSTETLHTCGEIDTNRPDWKFMHFYRPKAYAPQYNGGTH